MKDYFAVVGMIAGLSAFVYLVGKGPAMVRRCRRTVASADVMAVADPVRRPSASTESWRLWDEQCYTLEPLAKKLDRAGEWSR